MLRAIRDVAGVGQQLFYSKDGELVLKSITDDANTSRPSSVIETTSKRVSGASRRISAQFYGDTASPRMSGQLDGSMPPTPAREEFALDNRRCLPVVPKGGTLERLVDILVLGVEDFSRRMNGSDPVFTAENAPLLRMNMDVFTITFFATFRSYCSPIVLIDYLKKRLLGSKSAATISDNESDDVVFPDWTGVDHVSDESIDWNLVAKIHMGILEAVNTWISEFFIDFHCDQSLGDSFVSFLAIASKELAYWKHLGPEHGYLRRQADQINSLWYDVRGKFSNLSFLPLRYPTQRMSSPNGSLQIPPLTDIPAIEDFVNSLEVKVLESFRMVKLVDWMTAFEIFETQSSESLGFFVPKVALLSHDDDEVLQDIFFVLRNVRRGNLAVTLLETLPRPLRELCNLRSDITGWVLAQIVDHQLNADRRAHRIATLLRCLAISRKRMSGMDLYEDTRGGARQQVPSFVASAIAAALIRPESRVFGYAWMMGVRMTAGAVTQIETLEQVIVEEPEGIRSSKPLTPCVGWVIERLLEIICYVPNMVVENNRLINFDKRRYVYNFVNNFTHVGSEKSADEHLSVCTGVSLSYPRLPEMRTLRELAAKENHPVRQSRIKVFYKLLHHEQEKLRRDAKQRDAIERQQRQQLRAEHRRQPTAPNLQAADKRSNKRLGVNSIFRAVRPISMALTGWTPPQSSTRTVAPTDLPALKAIEHGKKPSSTIDLASVASVSCPKTTRDRHIWKVRTDQGVSYLFQALSEKDLEGWLRTIASIRGINATDTTESIDGLTVMSQNRVPQPVFGVSLDDLCMRDHVKVPIVVEALLSEIETRGIDEVGIYRVPGSLSSINALKNALDSGEEVRMDDDRWYDINAIAGAFKLLMRELPDKALGDEALYELRNITSGVTDDDQRALAFREVMLRLPVNNYNFLRRVYTHFARIASNAAINKMHAVNLAIVFGMGLSPGSLNMPLSVSPDLGLYQTMVKVWITHAELVFPEVEDYEDRESASVSKAESVEIQSSEPSSPAIEHSSPRMSLDDSRPRLYVESDKGSV
ncbi:hypothetical protein HOY80DRAFT_1097578 [Tuber brumale]|nr:hypothetical protein HOY80DRAFT_1097578 [Tuber brumale]